MPRIKNIFCLVVLLSFTVLSLKSNEDDLWDDIIQLTSLEEQMVQN